VVWKPTSEKEDEMANEVAWVEVLGKDGEKLKSFYGDLFGWKIDKVPGDIPYWTHNPEGKVGAGVGQAQEGNGHVTFYVAADDPQAVLDKAERLGGKTVMPVTEMEMVTFGLVADPEGHVIGVLKA
jgi:predicted enzyme related to lactoylglutathione lyase